MCIRDRDSDGDSMFDGWEYYFNFDPFDGADSHVDGDNDGYDNWCEHKWHTHPKEGNSYPGQGQLCDQYG